MSEIYYYDLIKEIKQYKVLSRNEEIKLFKEYNSGSTLAKETIIKHNLRLVCSIANKYQLSSMTKEDLFQEGVFGLIEAAQKFKVEKGFKFSTYAIWWIRQKIKLSIKQKDKSIRMPKWIDNLIYEIKKTCENLEKETNGKYKIEDIAKVLNIEVDKIREVDTLIEMQPVSLDVSINNDGDLILMDTIKFDKTTEEEVIRKQLTKELKKSINILKVEPRDKEIFKYRFGLFGYKQKTQKEVANLFNLTPQRIDQIEKKIIRIIKNECKNLKNYIDNE